MASELRSITRHRPSNQKNHYRRFRKQRTDPFLELRQHPFNTFSNRRVETIPTEDTVRLLQEEPYFIDEGSTVGRIRGLAFSLPSRINVSL